MKKNIVSMLLTLMLLMSIPLPASAAGLSFRDVPPDHWAASAIMAMTERGLLNGITDPDENGVGLFDPNGNMSRSQLVTIAARYLDHDALSALPAGEHWYSSAYHLLLTRGILQAGELDGGKLDQPVTREEMALIISRLAATQNKVPDKLLDASAIPDFSAVTPAYQDGVLIAYSLGILCGVDAQGTFSPKGILNRAQASTVFYRLIGVPANQTERPTPPPPDIPNRPATALSATEISNLASPAVFYVEVSDQYGEPFATGSGFFIDKTGVGVTNYHVIDGAHSAVLMTPDGKTYTMGTVLYHDKGRDVVIFQANGTNGNVPFLKLADPETIHNGDQVYAIGSPRGLQNSITDGLVSNSNRILAGDTYTYIQTSAPISPGSSGGPLLNDRGEVIGINTAGLTDSQNLNLAIPVSEFNHINYKNQNAWKTLSQIAGSESRPTPPPQLQPPTQQALPAPTNLRVVDTDDNAAYIQWDIVPGADYYYVYFRQQGDSDFWYQNDDVYPGPMRFYWTSNYSLHYYDLIPGTTYEIVVSAVRNSVESESSDILSFTFWGDTSNTTTSIPYYRDAWWVPDFGALNGIRPSYYNNDGECAYYTYDLYYMPSTTLDDYYDVLNSVGYIIDPLGTQSLTDGGSFNVPIMLYIPGTSFSVVTDIDRYTGDFIVMTLL